MMRAWLEKNDGSHVVFEANCYLGRAQASTVHLQSPGASRRHAHIHAQQADSGIEYWIADLGSTNGTLRNGKRVTIPCRLVDGDVVTILDDSFTFHTDESSVVASAMDTEAPATVAVLASPLCWLLMLDIKAFTRLSRELPPDQLGLKVGTWLRQCRDAIEQAGGVIDKFLGDALFAYWKHGPDTVAQLAATLRQLRAMQQARDPDFRIVLHHARTTMAGGAGGANNLSGPEVIYVFRMEKVSSSLKTDTILSEAASKALGSTFASAPLGEHPLDGFAGTHPLFTLPE
ncbi:MAG: family 3 adenylate cyclase [Verrucomicrobia bacterium]|nr:family 3 adenylate cyclase [Verrucomicrobiota bacterium]